MNEQHFREIKAIIMTCIKEAIAGEMDDTDNADSGAEMILRLGYTKLTTTQSARRKEKG